MDHGIEVCFFGTVLVHFVAKCFDNLSLIAFIISFVWSSSKANDDAVLILCFLVESEQVLEHPLVTFIYDHDFGFWILLHFKVSLVANSFGVLLSLTIVIYLKLLVTFCIISPEAFMLENDIYFILSMLKKEISDGCVNAAFSLSSWNYPDLVLLVL